jgi:hypothetical protein
METFTRAEDRGIPQYLGYQGEKEDVKVEGSDTDVEYDDAASKARPI